MHVQARVNKTVFHGEPSNCMPPARERFCDLDLWTHHLENVTFSSPDYNKYIWQSFSSEFFSGSRAIEITRFPYPSLRYFDLRPHDLENLYSKPTRTVNVCAKFHWNSTNEYRLLKRQIGVNGRTTHRRRKGRPEHICLLFYAYYRGEV